MSNLTKNSKNKELAEVCKEQLETFKPFVYWKSDPVVAKNGRTYQQLYIAMGEPMQDEGKMTSLSRELAGFSSIKIHRAIVNTDVEALKANTKLSDKFSALLTPIDGIRLIVSQTTDKPYETATPRIKPANNNDDEEQILCTGENLPVYEIATIDYGTGIQYNKYEDLYYVPRSIFDNSFVEMK